MGLTDKHLAYGDDIPQTQAEKDYYWKTKHLEEQNNKLKEALCEKTGKWIDDEFGSKCSYCDKYTHLDKFDRPMKFMYCSMCGAKMIKPEESEEEK